MKIKWYLQTWFILLLAILWPLYFIPLLLAIILTYLQHKQIFSEIMQTSNYLLSKKDDADNLLTNARDEAENILTEARSNADKLLIDANSKFKIITDKTANLNEDIKALHKQKTALTAEVKSLTDEVLLKSISLTAYEGLTSEECKNLLQMLSIKQQELVKSGEALVITSNDPKKILNNNVKQLLRCFHSECQNIISNVTVKNIDASRSKIAKSFEVLNRIFSTDGMAISTVYLETELEELNLVYTYQLKKEQEREIQKAIRDQMIEEEKVRKEIEREKTKIAKEETQFKNEINKLMGYMQKSSNEVQSQLYVDKIRELEEKIQLLEKDKANVLEREQNTRAGFVYIVSNIGSFGEDIYKIGMTRRLEPMDRIKELGDASVPFKFDVHALIFSEDAPALENTLHQAFKKYEVNKVNPRKEFFKLPLAEIRSVVIENHNATVDFIMEPEAEDYRQSLLFTEAV